MKFKRLSIKDIIEITPKNIIDNRGYFSEIYRKDLLDNFIGKKINFCQENKSKSVKNVFRGLHYQLPPNDQTKLLSVIEGKIIDVVVDLRVYSKTFKNFLCVEISSENKKQLFIPTGFAHGFLVLSDIAIISYKVDSFYNKKYERILNPLDPEIGLNLDLKNKLMSDKDKSAPFLNKIELFKWKKTFGLLEKKVN